MAGVAVSYLIDAALLSGFAYVGTVGATIPLYYLLAGPGRSLLRPVSEADSSDFDPVPESFPVFRLPTPAPRR